MSPDEPIGPDESSRRGRSSRGRRLLRAVGLTLVLLVLLFLAAAEYAARHLGPLLRSSVVATLSQRFHAPVSLGSLQVSVLKGLGGIEVEGRGLRVLSPAALAAPAPATTPGPVPPLLSLQSFRFRASLASLLHRHLDLAWVSIDGLELHLPPHRPPVGPAGPASFVAPQAPIRITLHRIECQNANLYIASSQPGRRPLTFRIQDLKLTVPDSGAPAPAPADSDASAPITANSVPALLYDALLINPKPVGAIHATGRFGPWNRSDPRSTPVDGHYTFSNADLGSIRGISGTLFSTGDFKGVLDRVQIDGTTRTPNFALGARHHPMPLSTTFHAYVDGTTGNTTLTSVQALLAHSRFSAQGSIVNIHGHGHDVRLTAHMANGRIEDVLWLVMKSPRPAMLGALALDARIHIPPGRERVIEKLQLAGTVNIQAVRFTNVKLQDRIDSLSLRAQGKPAQASAAQSSGSGSPPMVASQMTVTFTFDKAMLTVPSLQYIVPGGTAELHGAYFLGVGAFQFVGLVRTQARASQMVTGWKSILLRSLNPLFKAQGAGLQLPVLITGSNNTVHFGLDSRGVNEPVEQIAAGLRTAYPSPATEAPAKNSESNGPGSNPEARPSSNMGTSPNPHP